MKKVKLNKNKLHSDIKEFLKERTLPPSFSSRPPKINIPSRQVRYTQHKG